MLLHSVALLAIATICHPPNNHPSSACVAHKNVYLSIHTIHLPRMCSLSHSLQVLVDSSIDGSGVRAHDIAHDFVTLEDHERGHGAHVVFLHQAGALRGSAGGGGGVAGGLDFVDVDFEEADVCVFV